MCRLYGFHATEPTKVECTLIHEQNSLLAQSRSDSRGVSHADGWGIAWYPNGEPEVERRAFAAYQDFHFSAAAERTFAKTVVAHIRKATVGNSSVKNTHPFRYARWIFAHNGTLTAFEKIRARMEGETRPKLLEHRHGDTDSELSFFWLLTRMAEADIDLESFSPDLSRLMTVMGRSVKQLARWCVEEEAEKPRLNFLLTEGTVLVGSRWNHTLYWVSREGIHDCEICGIPHIHHQEHADYRARVVASEPVSRESWEEIPNQHVLGIDQAMQVRVEAIN